MEWFVYIFNMAEILSFYWSHPPTTLHTRILKAAGANLEMPGVFSSANWAPPPQLLPRTPPCLSFESGFWCEMNILFRLASIIFGSLASSTAYHFFLPSDENTSAVLHRPAAVGALGQLLVVGDKVIKLTERQSNKLISSKEAKKQDPEQNNENTAGQCGCKI